MSEVVTGVEDFCPLRSDVNQVTEEAVQRVQAQSKQAKQVAQQIKKDKAINYHLAQFLSFLMKEIQNEELIKAITDTFFKTTNPKNQITYLRKDINTYVVVWFFIPFFLEAAQEAKILWFYAWLWYEMADQSLKNYVNYLEKLSEKYHDNIPIDQNALIHLVVLIAKEWISANLSLSEEEIRETVISSLS